MPIAPKAAAEAAAPDRPTVIVKDKADRYEPENKWTEDGDVTLLHNFSRQSFVQKLPSESHNQIGLHSTQSTTSTALNCLWNFLPQTCHYPHDVNDPFVTYDDTISKVGSRRYRRVRFPDKVRANKRRSAQKKDANVNVPSPKETRQKNATSNHKKNTGAPPELSSNPQFSNSGFYDDGTYVASSFAIDDNNKYMAVGTESGYVHVLNIETVVLDVKHLNCRGYILPTSERSPSSPEKPNPNPERSPMTPSTTTQSPEKENKSHSSKHYSKESNATLTVVDCTPSYWISSLCFSNSSSSLIISTNHQIFSINIHTDQLLWRHVHNFGPAESIKKDWNGERFMGRFYACANSKLGEGEYPGGFCGVVCREGVKEFRLTSKHIILTHPLPPRPSLAQILSHATEGQTSSSPLSSAIFSPYNPTEIFALQEDSIPSDLLSTSHLPKNAPHKKTTILHRIQKRGNDNISIQYVTMEQPKITAANIFKTGGYLELSSSGSVLCTTGVGSGVRVYLTKSFALLGIYGEGLRSMGGVMEFNQCMFVESGGVYYVAGTPSCWRKDNEEMGGEMFGKIHFWRCDSTFFSNYEKQEAEGTAGNAPKEGVLEGELRDMGGHASKTFADRMLRIPTVLGMQQVAWSGRKLIGLGCGGSLGVISDPGVSEWPGAMYPPGYKIVNNNYFFVEKEDELDLKISKPNPKEGKGKNNNNDPSDPSDLSWLADPEDQPVDILALDSEQSRQESDGVVISTQFDLVAAQKLAEADAQAGGGSGDGGKTQRGGDGDGVSPDDPMTWFMNLLPKNQTSETDNNKSNANHFSKGYNPSQFNAEANNGNPGSLSNFMAMRQLTKASGEGSALNREKLLGNEMSCTACLGRLALHTCGKKQPFDAKPVKYVPPPPPAKVKTIFKDDIEELDVYGQPLRGSGGASAASSSVDGRKRKGKGASSGKRAKTSASNNNNTRSGGMPGLLDVPATNRLGMQVTFKASPNQEATQGHNRIGVIVGRLASGSIVSNHLNTIAAHNLEQSGPSEWCYFCQWYEAGRSTSECPITLEEAKNLMIYAKGGETGGVVVQPQLLYIDSLITVFR
ncbi:hypothetical protein TL16_g07009 [Triparma laevis f. inornata]|uniref:Uncharacterized protein n=1 Tax=Triparma laevis f. inornata TaxID=1714386 RepID=A0A9W7ANI8_9STRA|nr:hypothetical protein TL16_g07009 [Triparma laevis f. inornata]